jgi:hypothetical protein
MEMRVRARELVIGQWMEACQQRNMQCHLRFDFGPYEVVKGRVTQEFLTGLQAAP